jgi:hypothetical protein
MLSLSGCRTFQHLSPPPIRYTDKAAPVFLMKYYPYRPNGYFIAQPVPNYTGWTGERMERDLGRMTLIGIDGVLVVVTPGMFADRFRRDRLLAFISMARRTDLRIGFFLEPGPGGSTFQREALGEWVVAAGLRSAPACMKRNGRPLFIVGPGVRLDGPNHPAVSFVHTKPVFREWRWPNPGAAKRWHLGKPGDQVLVRAGFRGADGVADDEKTWTLPRSRGKTLQRQLWRAYDLRALTICISSWNDYTSGDFVEPNTLDGRAAYELLALEIARARRKIANEVQRAERSRARASR